MTHPVQRNRLRHKGSYSPAQVRVLEALAAKEGPCTAADLTIKGLIAPTVLTLHCLMRKKLVNSQVTRRSDVERPFPVYMLTDKGKEVVAQLANDSVDPLTARSARFARGAGQYRPVRSDRGLLSRMGSVRDVLDTHRVLAELEVTMN